MPLTMEALVLAHFSARYGAGEIVSAIRQEAKRLKLAFPVYAVLPGIVSKDVLGDVAAWQP